MPCASSRALGAAPSCTTVFGGSWGPPRRPRCPTATATAPPRRSRLPAGIVTVEVLAVIGRLASPEESDSSSRDAGGIATFGFVTVSRFVVVADSTLAARRRRRAALRGDSSSSDASAVPSSTESSSSPGSGVPFDSLAPHRPRTRHRPDHALRRPPDPPATPAATPRHAAVAAAPIRFIVAGHHQRRRGGPVHSPRPCPGVIQGRPTTTSVVDNGFTSGYLDRLDDIGRQEQQAVAASVGGARRPTPEWRSPLRRTADRSTTALLRGPVNRRLGETRAAVLGQGSWPPPAESESARQRPGIVRLGAPSAPIVPDSTERPYQPASRSSVLRTIKAISRSMLDLR